MKKRIEYVYTMQAVRAPNDFLVAMGYLPQSHPIRTKQSHPYSYDPFYRLRRAGKATDGAYTDRMSEWDYAKFEGCRKRHFKDVSWHNADAKSIECFIQDYFANENLVLVHVIECCNQATGYPVWYVGWKVKSKKK